MVNGTFYTYSMQASQQIEFYFCKGVFQKSSAIILHGTELIFLHPFRYVVAHYNDQILCCWLISEVLNHLHVNWMCAEYVLVTIITSLLQDNY